MQTLAALAIVAIAFLYLIHKLSGWPRRKKPSPEMQPLMGARLARGLRSAQRRDESRPPPPPDNAGDPRAAQ